jgi:phosphoribosylformylglycinamidine synthase
MGNEKTVQFDISQIKEPKDINDVIMNLMVNPNLSPLNYFNDFTDGVADMDMQNADSINESGIFKLENGGGLLSMTTHAMHHHLELDPQKAAEILISRAARKMVCYGARPVAITAMLYHINFSDVNGNYIATGVKQGIDNAAEVYNLKVSDRKIRFDYFGAHGKQAPTLIVTLMGIMPTDETQNLKLLNPDLKAKGNNIFMLGRTSDDIATSDYLEFYHGVTNSPLPQFDLLFEVKLQEALKTLIAKNLILSAGPVAKGGLFFTLLRAGWPNGLGFDITTTAETRLDSFLFGESMGRIVVTVDSDNEDDFVDTLKDAKIPFFTLGHVTKGEIRIDDKSYGYIDKMTGAL